MNETSEEKRFPIMTTRKPGVAPHPMSVPWYIAEKAYSQYVKEHGRGQSLERLAERGGFGACEMDMLYPGWRDEVSELVSLRSTVADLTAKLAKAEKFKVYTHQRLDELGAPHEVPESEHTKAGCRVGGRFDWMANELQRTKRNCQENLDGKREQEHRKKDALKQLAAANQEVERLRPLAAFLSSAAVGREAVRCVIDELVDQEASDKRPHTHVDFDEQIRGLAALDVALAALLAPSEAKEGSDG